MSSLVKTHKYFCLQECKPNIHNIGHNRDSLCNKQHSSSVSTMNKLSGKIVKRLLLRGRPPDPVKRCLYLAPPFLVGDYEPVAVKTYREGRLGEKVELARAELEQCVACPRLCRVNRLEDKKGACNTGRLVLHNNYCFICCVTRSECKK